MTQPVRDTAVHGRPVGRFSRTTASSRTVRAMLATALMIVPLWSLFLNHAWLRDAWLAVVVVGAPAAVLRIVYPARVWQTWVGIVLLIPVLTARFASAHAYGGVIPSGRTWTDISDMLDAVRRLSNDGVAPVHATPAVAFVLSLLGGLLTAFVDLIAVVGRRGAIAGVPILVVYTIVGAVTRHPVSWLLFVCSAVSFLLLLSLDAADTARHWGQMVPGRGGHRTTSALGVSGPRIAVIAIAVAAIVPLLVPARPSNLLANAFHSSGSGTGPAGFGTGHGVALDPFVSLHGFLERSKPTTLFTVTVSPATASPFYLRTNVLSRYSGDGWTEGPHQLQDPIEATSFDTLPIASSGVDNEQFTANITVNNSIDNPPVFTLPDFVSGVDRATTWSQADQILTNAKVRHGEQIQEHVVQPRPTIDQLEAATNAPTADLSPWLGRPRLPSAVTKLVASLTKNATTPYDKARALSDYFTNPANGFIYSLSAVQGDSGNALVDFLTNKAGYCQQYAAALAVMLRVAGIPSRVVLGYTHGPADGNGRFTITTSNAHAWVEAYFAGVGWVQFDPTPLGSNQGGATINLPWAPHSSATASPSGGGLSSLSVGARSAASSSSSTPVGPQAGGGGSTSVPWSGIGVGIGALALIALLLAPAGLRWQRRLGRLRAARRGDPDAAWAELADIARDLGYVWSPARSPRQVATWLRDQLGGGAGAGDALSTLALAVEHTRYAPAGPQARSLVTELRAVEGRMRERSSASMRWRARLFPASLGGPMTWRRPRRRR